MAQIHIDRLLETVVKRGVSDLHLHCDRPPVVRLHGKMRSLETKVLEPEDTIALMKSITPDRNQQELQEEGTTDFGFAFGTQARFRVSAYHQKGKVSIVLRQIPSKLLTFDEIGLPQVARALCRRPRGIFLVTGPTGSGKTTTLATMIDYINAELDRHIVTVEDPIEYYHTHKKSVISQREVGTDVPSFSEALRRVLRQDPDVILVGEMRDLETMESAIASAETGHLVFSTVHTTGAQGTVNRIIDAFPVNQQEQIRVQLSTNLIAVLSQVLLPRAGVSGRVAGYEFMVVTPAIANLIRENKTYRIDSSIQTGKKYGMQLLDEHLWSLYERGMVAAQDMLDSARNPGELKLKVEQHDAEAAAGLEDQIGGEVKEKDEEEED